MSTAVSARFDSVSPPALRFGVPALLGLGLVWAYWPTLGALANTWARDPQYSHGFLVPVFAAVLLWQRRGMLQAVTFEPCWWGLPFLAFAAVLRLAAAWFFYPWFDTVSLLPCLVGVAVLCGGWPALRWSWPGIAFLLFMFPLPYRLGIFMAPTLQRLATVVSTYALQTLGFPAMSEGNIIMLNEARIGVVEACGGLSMLIVFFALTTAVAMLIRADIKDKIFIVLSALPIAVIANVARITLTSMLHDLAGRNAADAFHDIAGWFMMPLALGML
ncbi:MAG: exosortase/archaeosortase family protein, partial [Planctomycetia bacterium]|nr:exosortase/archaeosortase family protein [Planctomycetia bacterium]